MASKLFIACVAGIVFFFTTGCAQITGETGMTDAGGASFGRQENPFGVLEFLNWDFDWSNFKYAREEDLRRAVGLMREAGVGWVRMDFLWGDIQPRPDEWRFEKYDRIVGILRENGIQVLGLLNYSAPWATKTGQWNYPPERDDDFVAYAVAVITRYRDTVTHWEIWNEPDSPTYWVPQDGMKRYIGLLRAVYAAAKRANPRCVILNGGLANGVASVNRLYDHGGQGAFDILNIHYFDDPAREGALGAVAGYAKLAYKIMSRNGDAGKKIWVTEIGAPGMPAGVTAANWWMGKNTDEELQAQWLQAVYAKLLQDPQVEVVFWAFWRDCRGHWNNGTDYFGIVRWDFSKKPAFEAYQKSVAAWKAKSR